MATDVNRLIADQKFGGYHALILLMCAAAMFADGFDTQAMGYIAPDTAVGMKTRKRRESMQAQLPHALDLLAVTVEAGLTFEAAVAKLSDRMQGPLVDEFENSPRLLAAA